MSGYDETSLRRMHELSNRLVRAVSDADGVPVIERMHALAWCSVWFLMNVGGPDMLPELKSMYASMMDDVERCMGPEQIATARATAEDFSARIFGVAQ